MNRSVRAGLRGLGELLVTAGLVVLLFLAYQLVWTNLSAHRAADRAAATLRESWARPGAGTRTDSGTDIGQTNLRTRTGTGFAFLHIPRLGQGFDVPVIEGVGLPDLSRGVGHYPGTALPGAIGNFAVAGHRATNGEPFAYLDKVHRGDLVVAETRAGWYTYVVDRTRIVTPSSTWVLDPVPGNRAATPSTALLTLTTCNPRWASYERLIVFGHLTGTRARADGPPPALAGGAGA